jgi:outer membrane protein assembly factor BamB
MRRFAPAAAFAASALVLVTALFAQRGGGDWMAIGYDAQRSSWVRGDGKISLETMSKPGFQLLWYMKLRNTPTPPALLDFYIGYKGFRALGFVSSADGVTGIDVDIARTEWERSIGATRAATGPCPGGVTSSVARPTGLGYPGAPAIRGAGRGSMPKSGVGGPGEGAITIKQAPPQAGSPPAPPANARRGAQRTAPPANPFARTASFVASLSADGKLHMMYVSNGEEPNPPIQFLPPNAHARALSVFDGIAYVATVNGCGGVPDGIWSLDLQSKKVTQWRAPAGVAGTMGPAVSPDGTLYVASGADLVALGPDTLQPKATYKTGGAKFTSSPLVFDFKGKDMVVAATDDGRLHLVDSSLGNVAVSTVFAVPGFASGSIASWEQGGTRWVAAPNGVNVTAFKIAEGSGALSFEPGWVAARDMVSPLGPAVVNNVVFVLSSGEWRVGTAAQRAASTTRAMLVAMDGATGRELWNSGEVMATHALPGALAGGGGRVYVSGADGTLYAFGFPMEH